MQLINFKEANCKNCYRCVRACPVKAIRFQDHQAIIDDTRCIACGQCFLACPQNARDIQSDLPKLRKAFEKEKNVVALIAPSFAGFYRNKGGFIHGLKELGFSKVVEVSSGADEVTRAYERFMVEENPFYAISSCCPTVNLFIRRYYEELSDYLIPVVSPMLATGKAVKGEDRESYTVFISPCLSKKCEPLTFGNEGTVDAVITMEEINQMFTERNLDPEVLSPNRPEISGNDLGKKYPLKGGIGEGFESVLTEKGYDILHVEGIDQVKEVLEELRSGSLGRVFLELNACHESCISGPCIPKKTISTFLRKQLVKNHVKTGWLEKGSTLSFSGMDLKTTYMRNPVRKKQFSEKEILTTLGRMGKRKPKDELDCGACGYDSCREKARAVLEGMSDVEMCMPFMRTRAEHMNDIIFYNSPNMIFILDEDLCITQMNPSAEITFKVKADEVKNLPIQFLLEDQGFSRVKTSGYNDLNRRIIYEEAGLIVMQSILFLPKDNQILVIMSDITEEENRRQELQTMKENTIAITNKVIEKQMRVAHEIASLLGETTAETKIALNRLKEIVQEEGS